MTNMTQVLSTCMTRTPCVLTTTPIRSSHLISHANHTNTQDHSTVTVMRAQNCSPTMTMHTQVPRDNNGHSPHDDYLGPEPCATTWTLNPRATTTWAPSSCAVMTTRTHSPISSTGPQNRHANVPSRDPCPRNNKYIPATSIPARQQR